MFLRRADFVAKYFGESNYQAIAHVEFQSVNDSNMLAREFDYAAQLNYEYPDYDILQFVLLLGPNPPTMKTRLKRRFFDFGYQLFWIKEIPYQLLMASEKPELLLLAAFADYGDKTAETVFSEVAQAVKTRSESKMDFVKFMDQLHIFSKLHNLQPVFKAVMIDILKIVDITDDWFYLEGEKKGIEQGIEQGEVRKSLKVCISLIKTSDLDDAKIALSINLPLETVKKIRDIIASHPTNYWELVMNLFATDK